LSFATFATFQKMVATELGPSLLSFCVLASFSPIWGQVPQGVRHPGDHPNGGICSQSYYLYSFELLKKVAKVAKDAKSMWHRHNSVATISGVCDHWTQSIVNRMVQRLHGLTLGPSVRHPRLYQFQLSPSGSKIFVKNKRLALKLKRRKFLPKGGPSRQKTCELV
jgi:hypothetical protein